MFAFGIAQLRKILYDTLVKKFVRKAVVPPSNLPVTARARHRPPGEFRGQCCNMGVSVMMKLCTRLLAVVGFLATAGTASAEGFALYEYSARGVALGGATVARKPDPSAVAYNPALITRLKGANVQAGISAITPSGYMSSEDPANGGTDTHLKASTWMVPNFYYTQQINDKFTFGIGEFSRFGLGFEYPHNWPGKNNVYQVELTTASVNPNIAWAVTDKLSLAVGLEVMYLNLDLKKKSPLPLPNAQVDANIQNADSVGYGGNLAAHYQFNEQWGAGLVYRSQIKQRAEGVNEMTVENVPSWIVNGSPLLSNMDKDHNAHGTVVLPDSLAGAVSWSPMPELSFELGAIWTRWSTFKNLSIHTDDVGVSRSKKYWDDAWRLNFGVEYDALDWLTLRAGFVYDQSPMTEAYEDYLIPTDGRYIYSAGLGFHWNAWTLDLAYAYIDAVGRKYSARPADGVLDSHAKSTRTDIFSLSVGYQF